MAHKILIIEDNPVQMKLACKMLERIENLDIFQANNGAQARKHLQESKIDIVLCDIGLPDESGLDLTQFMVKTYRDIIVIMLTADEDMATSEKAIEFGAFQYLVKPVKPSQLRISIQTALRVWKYQRVIRTQKTVMEAEIAHLKKTRQQLYASQEEFNSLFENIQEGFYRLDRDNLIVMANPVFLKILGYDAFEQIQGHHIIDFYSYPEEREDFLKVMKKTGKLATYEISLKHKTGKAVPVLVNAYIRKDEHGNPDGIEGTIVDISGRKRLESELLQSQKLESIGQLAAGIAHEINTPIQYVGDNAHFMEEAFEDLMQIVKPLKRFVSKAKNNQLQPDDIAQIEDAIEEADIEYLLEEIPDAIEQSIEGVRRVSRIVKSMKAFSHPGSDAKELYDINSAIENTVIVAKNEYKYVADLDLCLETDLPPIPCFPAEINQVLLNMIINAGHAIAEELKLNGGDRGSIRVETSCARDFIQIIIQDNGTGIPKDIQRKIFDPFFTTKEVGKGTGQGLAISHSVIVEKHSGQIVLKSEPGKGSKFIIKLPKAEC